MSPLLYAIYHHDEETARRLLNEGAKHGYKELTYAIECDNFPIVKMMIDEFHSTAYRFSTTILHDAIYTPNQDMAIYLLEKGATYVSGHLQRALHRCHERVVDALIAHGHTAADWDKDAVRVFKAMCPTEEEIRLFIKAGGKWC